MSRLTPPEVADWLATLRRVLHGELPAGATPTGAVLELDLDDTDPPTKQVRWVGGEARENLP